MGTYIDDLIGYNFIGKNNKPWDHDGHGTFVTGVIAATWNNKVGIAGINPNAKIMVLKALNGFGHTRASYVAEALVYAANHGAQIINMSLGGKDLTTLQREAVDYALSKGCLIVIAAGNEGRELKGFGIAELPSVITVGASDRKDKRAAFSNYDPEIDLVAPGLDIISLRARYTDTLRDIPGSNYSNGNAYVGKVNVAQGSDGQPVVEVIGTANADAILSISVKMGAGENPEQFTIASPPSTSDITEGVVGLIPASKFAGSTVWILKLIVRHQNGTQREARFRLQLG